MRAGLVALLLVAACGGGGDGAPDAQGDGTTCGGLLGLICLEGYYCDWPDDSCGAADATGVCRPVPETCTPVEQPVCGCDGTEHGNACEAAMRGADVDGNGGC